MMKRPTDRRTVLMTAGAAAVAAAAGPVAAQSPDIRGAVTFEGGAAIPEGQLEIYLEDPAIQDSARRRVAETRIEERRRVEDDRLFPVPRPPARQPRRRCGSLRAWSGRMAGCSRGAAHELEAGSPVDVTLNAVMY